MDDPPLSDRYQPLTPGITRVPFGDAEALRGAVGTDTAAVIMETIPATGGYLVAPDGYFTEMRRICDETGALMILDEVQAGLGRTGRVWAFEHFEVVPDVIVVGKGLSGGVYPVAACCFGDRVEAHFATDPFFHPSSYSGSELAARVVEAVAARYEQPDLLDHVLAVGKRLAAGLDELVAARPDRLAGHRGLGLMRALDTRSDAIGLGADQAVLRARPAGDLRLQPPVDAAGDAAAGHIGGGGRRSARAARCGRRCVVTVAGLAGPTD